MGKIEVKKRNESKKLVLTLTVILVLLTFTVTLSNLASQPQLTLHKTDNEKSIKSQGNPKVTMVPKPTSATGQIIIKIEKSSGNKTK